MKHPLFRKSFFSKRKLLLLLPILFLAGIGALIFQNQVPPSADARFESFTQELFLEEVTSNTLNLHYTLAYPEKYGIRDYEISLGSMQPEALDKNIRSLKSLQKKLNRFSDCELSPENQKIYDILRLKFATELSVKDNYMLQEPLGPNLGIQAQLPVLLAEYPFRTTGDIKNYFSLLSEVPAYFEQLLEFEEEKARQGIFMSDSSADRIIRQCTSFADESSGNYLYAMFEERIAELSDARKISAKQASSYIAMNQKLMEKSLLPAYETLAQGLLALKGSGTNDNGLFYLPEGRAYYAYLIKSNVGDYRTIDAIETTLQKQLLLDYREIQILQKKDPDILSKATGLSLSFSSSPEQMLAYLNRMMTDTFPTLQAGSYEVKYIPKSMEDFSSPAFYLTPPIDTLSPNTIYINQKSQVSPAELFTTLAHEGFPGHLYQTVYFGKQHASPIQTLLSCGGYVEGWATYAESLSYEYGAAFLGVAPDIMEFLRLNRSVSLCLYSLLDIGIHDKGWTLTEVSRTLSAFGITQKDTCQEIFQYIVENPANYLKYYLGYLNFCSLKESAQTLQGESFHIKDFHRTLLQIGPAPFPIVRKYLLNQSMQ